VDATAHADATARYVRTLPGFQLVGRYPWKHAELQLYADADPVPNPGGAVPQVRPQPPGATP